MSKAIKDKMERLDTLSGGIVFGKEEAWERLQVKLDKKPARKIALTYKIGVAAAAVLLLAVCITALYNKQEEKIAAAPALYQNETTQPTPSTPPVKENAAGVVTKELKEVRTAKHAQRATTATTIVEPAMPIPGPITTPDIAVIDPPSPPAATAAPPATKPKMRVVHINELDNEAPAEKPTYASTNVDIKNMKVVSANGETGSPLEIRRANRPHGPLPFFIPPTGNTASEKDVVTAHSPFNLQLSIQN